MLAGIREILLITTPTDLPAFERLLGDGSRLGLSLSYAAQPKPEGPAQAFVIGRRFVGTDAVALVLGDRLFYGHGFSRQLQEAAERPQGATVFAYYVKDPQRYGVVRFDERGRARHRGKAISAQVGDPQQGRTHSVVRPVDYRHCRIESDRQRKSKQRKTSSPRLRTGSAHRTAGAPRNSPVIVCSSRPPTSLNTCTTVPETAATGP